MGACLWVALWLLAGPLADPLLLVRAATVAALVAGGVLFFALFCQLTGVVDFRQSLATIRRA